MDMSVLYWVVFVVGFALSSYFYRNNGWPFWGFPLLYIVLFFLLGWKVFGFIIK